MHSCFIYIFEDFVPYAYLLSIKLTAKETKHVLVKKTVTFPTNAYHFRHAVRIFNALMVTSRMTIMFVSEKLHVCTLFCLHIP